MNKLKILISGVVLLMLTASFFGIVDYVKASEKGIFKTLYKDEANPGNTNTMEIGIEDYSRGIIESEPVPIEEITAKKETITVKELIKKEILNKPVVLATKIETKKVINSKNKISFKSFSRARLERIPPPKEIVIIDSTNAKN